MQWKDAGNLISITTATGDYIKFDEEYLPHGNDGWTLKEAQWLADNYVFI